MNIGATLAGKRVLVTGADGFIGSHLTERLVELGADVTAFVQYNSFGRAGWLDTSLPSVRNRLTILPGDIRDSRMVETAVDGHDIVFHLAALISIPFSYVAPQSYVETNVIGTLNMLEAARRHKLSRLVVTSTSEVFGSAQTTPMSETHPLNAQSPYAASKTAADQLALSYYRSFDVPVSVVRPFNTYGPRQSTRAVIPTIICQTLKNQGKIRLGALSPSRDFSYVADTVDGLIAMAETTAAIGEQINLGCGYSVTIGETVALISALMGIEISVESSEDRQRPEKSEVVMLLADNTKAREISSWRPKYSGIDGLKAGLAKSIEWYQNPSNIALFPSDLQL
jgi:dTDP-glucose 4,6-dehydratase